MNEQTSMRRTTEQRRAGQAWQKVGQVKDQSKYQGEYKSLVRSIPADILSHGLGQVLAFLWAKGRKNGQFKEDHHSMLYQHLSVWVSNEMGWGQDGDLLKKLTQGETATTANYRRATVETLAYLEWLKRFAEAELQDGGN